MNKKLIVGISLFIAVVSLVAYLFFYDDILEMYNGGENDDEFDDFAIDDIDINDTGDGLDLEPPVTTGPPPAAIEQPTSTEDPVEGSGAASAAAEQAAG